ncbi:uncharacterized protein LOC9317944 [Arabidopsis lyrata subsp. lyrata]|uniref:uncharacterized protein LOC9317944 n=1 Tax=Arabidopsis lyrata subsp. lyrata TaxID=81972 RepID=UPI000A29D812|nr:uncharacterized protein LOC9317944 [Arabidopsis lyrata subsp. lyrata]|eukprot:XP_020884767.1 uncharacterized protein LOC9317944 [Arabidopsis lyrata subsp. lyrata]
MVICISKENQPAFDHPLLMYHKIQEAPTEIPRVIGTNKKSEWPTSEAHVSTAKCPQDKVPIQNMTALSHRAKPERGNNNTSVIPKHEHAVALARGIPKVYGTKAVINIWEPVVEDKKIEMSISQIWITSGDFDTNDLNSIEVGWQVDPIVYKDNKPRLFVYWTSDAYRTTGGYNLRKPGFIQTSSEIVLGGSISPVSSFGGSQFEITILVWKDSKSGNWWLSLGPDNVLVGYWPREIFSSLADHGTKLDWGGEIIDSHSFGRHTKTQMGSGRFPEEGFGNASYVRNLEMVDDTNTLQPIEVKRYYSDGPYYSTKKLHTDEWGTHFFFGGPGLSLYFIYFSFNLEG